MRAAVEALVQAALEAEMTEAIGAERGSGPRPSCPTAVAITAAH